MAEETNHVMRKGRRKGSKDKRKQKPFRRTGDNVKKVNGRMKSLFRKRARDYNSDDDVDKNEESDPVIKDENETARKKTRVFEKSFAEKKVMDGSDSGEENEFSENEDDELLPGITKFSEGCKAFKMAFKTVMKKSVAVGSLGPVLSSQQKLVAEKLAEEDAERKVKGDSKREKHLVAEKGHVKLERFVSTHDKFLIGVATKGVVKLFNAVNKAQNAQKGLDPSRFKDAKALKKHRKDAFFSELRKTSSATDTSKDGEGPAWAPLRDNYMLTNLKLKDWDKMQGNAISDDTERMREGSSSEDSDSDSD